MPVCPALKELLNPSKKKRSVERLGRYLEEGGSIGEILRLQPAFLEKIYAAGYRHFERENYPLARQTFAYLTFLAPQYPKYWKALGATQALLEDFESAEKTYAIATQLDPQDKEMQTFLNFCKERGR